MRFVFALALVICLSVAFSAPAFSDQMIGPESAQSATELEYKAAVREAFAEARVCIPWLLLVCGLAGIAALLGVLLSRSEVPSIRETKELSDRNKEGVYLSEFKRAKAEK